MLFLIYTYVLRKRKKARKKERKKEEAESQLGKRHTRTNEEVGNGEK
jgi:hypothetical protein